MTIPTIFDACRPRLDVLHGGISDADFTADLSSAVSGSKATEYRDPVRFFADTYPTRGLKNLLANGCHRLAASGAEVATIFRLDTSYGGGNTHALIALTHAARNGRSVPNIAEFLDPTLLAEGTVRIAAFDGENADPANGRRMGNGVLAHTPGARSPTRSPARLHSIAFARATRRGSLQARRLFASCSPANPPSSSSTNCRYTCARSSAAATAQISSPRSSPRCSRPSKAPQTPRWSTRAAIGRDGHASDAYTQENQLMSTHKGRKTFADFMAKQDRSQLEARNDQLGTETS